jgi:hypothetical protein
MLNALITLIILIMLENQGVQDAQGAQHICGYSG